MIGDEGAAAGAGGVAVLQAGEAEGQVPGAGAVRGWMVWPQQRQVTGSSILDSS